MRRRVGLRHSWVRKSLRRRYDGLRRRCLDRLYLGHHHGLDGRLGVKHRLGVNWRDRGRYRWRRSL
jgi:hypothetical protein